jgi:nicotinamidase-related amidase
MPYTLVVVDFQYEFKASRKRKTIEACKNAIIKAINDEAVIVFLEYIGCGRTMKSLFNLVDTYESVHFIRKVGCDGSLEIKVIENMLATEHFRVCGVNTDACVEETVLGLNSEYPEAVIEVLEQACNSDLSHEQGILNMLACKQVVINKSPIKL